MNHQWNNVIGGDASETGSGPGSYDIRQSVWHVNVSQEQRENEQRMRLTLNPVLQP